jgi:hypothetical protein
MPYLYCGLCILAQPDLQLQPVWARGCTAFCKARQWRIGCSPRHADPAVRELHGLHELQYHFDAAVAIHAFLVTLVQSLDFGWDIFVK